MLRWVKSFAIFDLHEILFSSSRCLCWGCESDKSTLDCEIPSSPNTLQVLLAGFAYMISESTVLDLLDLLDLIIKVLATRVKFLELSSHCTMVNSAFAFHTTNVFGCFYSVWVVRLKVTGKGQGCVAIWISDSIVWLFYFIPMLASQCNTLPKEIPKRIIQKKRQQQIRDKVISFIFSFIYWVQQPFHG